jgi:3-hydroxyisobutyrate dehydrogenase-like beta-hydroxyacid dehydrogenase
MEERIGIVAPGAMGVALGRCLLAGGHQVLVALDGRSAATVARARPLTDCGDLDTLVASADAVLSVVPPGEALAVADELAAARERTGARPLVAELNAVAPAVVEKIAARLSGDLVDGAVSGAPPRPDSAAATRVFLSGPRAVEIAGLRAPGIRWIPLDGPVGAASAAKMCTASVRKGYQALLAHALLTAHAHGVLDTVLTDLRLDFPDAGVGPVAVAATKAWRFVDEMEQIAATQSAAGLTPQLFTAMAQVYRELATSSWGVRRPEDVSPASADLADLQPRRQPDVDGGPSST